MICAFLIFCSLVVNNPEVTLYPGYVSNMENMLAAHYQQDGKYFQLLQVGDYLYYEQDGEWKTYGVLSKIEWTGDNEQEAYYKYIYPADMVLVTCLSNDPKDGRLFVIMEEVCPRHSDC